jgi:hypothetical protein
VRNPVIVVHEIALNDGQRSDVKRLEQEIDGLLDEKEGIEA